MKRILLALGTLVLGGCGTDLAGPSSSMLACLFGEPRPLRVGEVVGFEGSGNRSICLATPDGAAVFAYVPFFAEPSPDEEGSTTRLAVDVLGGGILASAAWAADLSDPVPTEPRPGLLTGAESPGDPLRLGHGLHRLLREREVSELEPRIRAARPPIGPRVAAGAAAGPGVPAAADVGDMMAFNVALSCTSEDVRTGQVRAVAEHAIVVADVQNPTGFTSQDYDAFAAAFDTLVYPVATRHFGEPSDIDGNGRTIVFFTRAVNQLNPAGGGAFTAALFWAGDLFPAVATPRLEACPAANHAEMFYMAVPDPNGTVGPQVSVDWMRNRAVQVMAHEYQHLLNAARRLHVNEAPGFERTWLNEGLSHVAEELVFFEASGLPRRANITNALLQSTPGAVLAYNRYMETNHQNMARYLAGADTASLMGTDGFATRGGAWSFLRYAADRTGAGDEAVFFDLVNSMTAGVENLRRALGAPALEWMRDWAVALYADDHVPGLDPVYTQPSWNLRDIHRTPGGGYPLATVPLTAGSAHGMQLRQGGSAYLLFGVAADGLAAVHVEAGGSSPPRSLRGAFLRVR